jgi:GTP cyclohydrolase I
MRGVERVGSQTVTSCMLGSFREDGARRSSLLALAQTTRA